MNSSALQTTVSITTARTTLAELITQARLLRRVVLVTQRGKLKGAIVPSDLGVLIDELGVDNALAILTKASG